MTEEGKSYNNFTDAGCDKVGCQLEMQEVMEQMLELGEE